VLIVTIELPPARASTVAKSFEAEGFTDVRWTPPMERRTGVGGDVVRVAYHLGTLAAGGLIGQAAVLAAKRVIARLRERAPDIKASIREINVAESESQPPEE